MSKKFTPTRDRFEQSAKSWFGWYSFWLYLHYIIGLLIVIFSGLVATSIELGGTNISGWFGAASGILAAIVTFLRPNEKATTFKARWHLLNKALLDPKNAGHDITKFYEAYITAEAMSNGMVVNTKDGEDLPI